MEVAESDVLDVAGSAEFHWTRLQGTKIWDLAAEAYARNGLPYHNLEHHVRSMYSHALNTFSFPYDRNLDLAILSHDVLDSEALSADWFDEKNGKADRDVRRLIMGTVNHLPGCDDRLILLDLADFAFPERRRYNTNLLRDEALMRGSSEEEFRRDTIGYLDGLSFRVSFGIHNGPRSTRPEWWPRILKGIHAARGDLSQQLVASASPMGALEN